MLDILFSSILPAYCYFTITEPEAYFVARAYQITSLHNYCLICLHIPKDITVFLLCILNVFHSSVAQQSSS